MAVSRNDFSAAFEILPKMSAAGIDVVAENYVVPVRVVAGSNKAVLGIGDVTVAQAEQDGVIRWWADPRTSTELTVRWPGWEPQKVSSAEIAGGIDKTLVPRPILHVFASLEHVVLQAWALSDQHWLIMSPEDMWLLTHQEQPLAPPRSTSATSVPQTTFQIQWRRFIDQSTQPMLTGSSRPPFLFIDQAILHPWQPGRWELLAMDGQVQVSWPRSELPPQAPALWQGNIGSQMISWADGSGIRLGKWRGDLHRIGLGSDVLSGPLLS